MLVGAMPVRRTALIQRCSCRQRRLCSPHRSLSVRTPPPIAPLPPPLLNTPGSKPEMTMVDRLLRQRILAHGPVSVSDFMQEVLTAPIGGYYTEATPTDKKPSSGAVDVGVFGQRGDFVTAPEISQLFGELLGLWCIGLWQSAGSPTRVQLVELGPGRGKMMSDVLRTAKHFPAFNAALSVGMIEASPTLIRSQAEVMGVVDLSEFDASTTTTNSNAAPLSHADAKAGAGKEEGWVAAGATASGVPVQWFRHFSTAVPPLTSASAPAAGVSQDDEPLLIVLANEYWDALPARQFQLTDRGWCEVCVDVADEEEDAASPYHLKWALSPHESPAVAAYVPFVLEGERQRLRELGQQPRQSARGAADEVASSALPSPGSTVPGADPTEMAGGLNVAAERAKSAQLMKRKLDAALREGVIDEEKYEKAKAMLEQQGVHINPDPVGAGAGGVSSPAAEGQQEVMDRVEVCPAGLALVQEVSAVLQHRKGAALIIDYGADRTYSDSLQAVRGHRFHPVLSEPGTADVSCSVDFRSLRRAALALAVPETVGGRAAKPVVVHGPLTQGELLMGLGIEARLSQLVAAAGGEDTALGRSAIEGATRLVDSRTPSSMGRLFKALAITHADLPSPEPFATPTKELPE